MNNKILAVVLSIVAVVVVFYQIFLRKDDDQKNNKINKVQFVNRGNPTDRYTPPSALSRNMETDNMNGQGTEITSGRMLIDIYSEQLLERVKPYMDKSKVELMGDFGDNIFGNSVTQKKKVSETKIEKKVPSLHLVGIIEIIKNKIKVAIINSRLYRKGDIVENAIIEKIEKYRVLLKFNKEIIILTVNQAPYKGWIKKKIGGSS